MRVFSSRPLPRYRAARAASSSSRVAMLTRLIATPAAEPASGANQMRQRLNIREHFRRGNAATRVIILIVVLQPAAALTAPETPRWALGPGIEGTGSLGGLIT